MIIAHYKKTRIADAPDELSNAINKYSEHKSFVFDDTTNISGRPIDIIHNHNKSYKGPLHASCKKSLIQYHSEPYMVELNFPGRKLVIAQYHATLAPFSNCTVIRNVIDYNQPLYQYKEIKNEIRIGFSPSRRNKFGDWHDKGYDRTVNILNKIANMFDNVSVDIITDVPLNECIQRKSNCNIIIDECVTSSYHRSGLEGLALGKLTICSLDNKVENVLKEASGAPLTPFANIWIDNLENELIKIIEFGGIDYINKKGQESLLWMQTYWKPETIVSEFLKIYKEL